MEGVFRVDVFDWSGRTFGQSPERLAIFGFCVKRVGIE
jgi:hypothetical protein